VTSATRCRTIQRRGRRRDRTPDRGDRGRFQPRSSTGGGGVPCFSTRPLRSALSAFSKASRARKSRSPPSRQLTLPLVQIWERSLASSRAREGALGRLFRTFVPLGFGRGFPGRPCPSRVDARAEGPLSADLDATESSPVAVQRLRMSRQVTSARVSRYVATVSFAWYTDSRAGSSISGGLFKSSPEISRTRCLNHRSNSSCDCTNWENACSKFSLSM
jgi:hypothetical protein